MYLQPSLREELKCIGFEVSPIHFPEFLDHLRHQPKITFCSLTPLHTSQEKWRKSHNNQVRSFSCSMLLVKKVRSIDSFHFLDPFIHFSASCKNISQFLPCVTSAHVFYQKNILVLDLSIYWLGN